MTHKKTPNPEDYSHNYNKIRLKCPVCYQYAKKKHQVKIKHNLAALNWHITHEHFDISPQILEKIKESLKTISRNLSSGFIIVELVSCIVLDLSDDKLDVQYLRKSNKVSNDH